MTVLAAATFVALAGAQTEAWDGRARISDTPVYRTYGDRLAGGDVPYRDFDVEYPPGALPAFAAPSIVSDGALAYDRAFAALIVGCGLVMLLFVALTLAALGAGRLRFVLALGLPALAPVLLGPLVLTRFDLLPAALVAVTLAAVVSGRSRLGALALGLAIAVKLYPAVLLPLVVVDALRRRGRREALVVGGLAAGAVVAVSGAFLVVAPDGLARSVWRQIARPLQIESLGSGLLLALHHVAGVPLAWASGHGSQNLTGAVAVAVAVPLAIAQVSAIAWLWARYARGPVSAERLVLFSAAVLAVLVALGRVLSPQFLIWLLPVIPLVRGRRGLAASVLLVVACLLTRGWFPGSYWELVKEFDGRASILVLARDLCLLAIAAVLAWPPTVRATEHARARSPSLGPSPHRT